MPLAQGLFDKAIIESGGPANVGVKGYPKADDVPAGRALTREMMQETGVTDLAGLWRQAQADTVLVAAGAVGSPTRRHHGRDHLGRAGRRSRPAGRRVW